MAKCRRANKAADNDNGNREFHLPQAIIHHIQSYLNGKQAAQTAVISKSWYNAWLTRPTIDIDQRDFEKRDWGVTMARVTRRFSKYVKKTMKRYQVSNLKIENFRLFMYITGRNPVAIVNELVRKSLNLGVTDLSLEFASQKYVLPIEVLEAESLLRLSLSWCEIKPLVDRKVICSRIRYLSFRDVWADEDTVRDIVSRCPMIESLLLYSCRSNGVAPSRVWNFGNSLTESVKQTVGSVVVIDNSPIKVSGFCKLKYLLLQGLQFESSFFHDFSVKFPLLEDLGLHFCYYGGNGLEISSNSLKRISLKHISFEETELLHAKFDVPSIHKFTYYGTVIPSVTFTSTSRQWESDITISSYNRSTLWKLELKTFLSNLSRSRIYLTLPSFDEERTENAINDVNGVEGLPKPLLENLTLSVLPSLVNNPGLLDGLFFSCSPKIITVTWLLRHGVVLEEGNSKLLKTFTELIQEVGKCFCIPKENMCFSRHLKDVTLKFFDQNLREWQAMPLKAWLDAPRDRECSKRIFFQLNCQPLRHAGD